LVLLLSHRFRAVRRYHTCRSISRDGGPVSPGPWEALTATPGAAGGILLGQQPLVIALVVMAHLGLLCPGHGLAAGAAIKPVVGISGA
jgi:hypothetical protein